MFTMAIGTLRCDFRFGGRVLYQGTRVEVTHTPTDGKAKYRLLVKDSRDEILASEQIKASVLYSLKYTLDTGEPLPKREPRMMPA
jgi:hypothetical protein